MIRRLFRDEGVSSLVEVVVAIMILSIAIIPMVGMFDMGLKSAVRAGTYDQARTLANAKLEDAALPQTGFYGRQLLGEVQADQRALRACRFGRRDLGPL